MLTADEQIRNRLGKLDSPQRVRWLRNYISDYIINLAARVYFRLPLSCAGVELDPYIDAFDLSFRLARLYGFTDDERRAAFTAEWKRGIQYAEEAAEIFETAAARHIQLYRRRDNILETLMRQRKSLPPHAPHFTQSDIEKIARRFQHRARINQS